MSNNNAELLKQIMADNDLSSTDIARMFGRSVWTVYQWRSGVANMPSHLLQLLTYKVAERQPKAAAE